MKYRMEKTSEKIRTAYSVGILPKGERFELLYVKMRPHRDHETVL